MALRSHLLGTRNPRQTKNKSSYLLKKQKKNIQTDKMKYNIIIKKKKKLIFAYNDGMASLISRWRRIFFTQNLKKN